MAVYEEVEFDFSKRYQCEKVDQSKLDYLLTDF